MNYFAHVEIDRVLILGLYGFAVYPIKPDEKELVSPSARPVPATPGKKNRLDKKRWSLHAVKRRIGSKERV